METALIALSVVLGVALVFAIVLLLLQGHRRAQPSETAEALRAVVQAVQQAQLGMATVGERVAHLDQDQARVSQDVAALSNLSSAALAELQAVTRGLAQSASAIHAGLQQAQSDLTVLQATSEARQAEEQRVAESIRRLETVVAGTQSRGAAGENIIDIVFSKLPAEWQVRNFHVGGKSCEFGLRLPNNLILPIDSKWPATDLLDRFAVCEDPGEQQRLKKQIEGAVLARAKEVCKYVDPSLTVAFGVAVVPDAVYDLCGAVQAEAFTLNVVLVSYSLFVPYLLLVFQTILKSAQSIDLQKLASYVDALRAALAALQDELDGRVARAITMLGNSRDEMRAQLSRAGTSLTSLQGGPGAATAVESPPA